MESRPVKMGRPAPLFGISVAPWARNADQIVSLARVADELGLDLIGIQDHPYNAGFLDTWTLLSLLGGMTRHIRLLPDVANLPLRPPAMLARAAASLDILTAGRVELGLGAGGFWDAIVSYGGPQRTPGEAVAALEEAIYVIRLLWQPAAQGETVSFDGRFYQLHGAQPGPAPVHPIGIWIGALGPKMLDLVGRLAGGWIPSMPHVPPAALPAAQDRIDAAALRAGRKPEDIRRAYNIGGVVQGVGEAPAVARRQGILIGRPAQWIEQLARFYTELRQDTFIFWPAGQEPRRQIRLFAEEVVPGVRAAIGDRNSGA
jgi:alkanesulfonate monooxygenase SsuD/methylene tetrahydromethanopterin reductase-like flavin-dependent oxidoreductase (luciferase family)